MADPDPMTCDPGSRVYDPDPGTVIPDPIYLVTTLEDDYRTGCRNVSHCQREQSYSGLRSPARS